MKTWFVGWLLLVVCVPSAAASQRETLSLAGDWRFRLDPNNVGEKQAWFKQHLPDTIQLPGSTDEGGFGAPEKPKIRYNARP